MNKLAFVLLLLGLAAGARAAEVTVTPDTGAANIGDTIVFTYTMDFTSDSTLGGGTDFFYDPTVLQFVAWAFDPALVSDEPILRRVPTDCSMANTDAGCDFDADQFGPGLAQLNGLAFGNSGDSGMAGPDTIGTLTFVAVGEGSGTLLMDANDDGVPANPGPFVSGNSFQIQLVNFSSGVVTISSGADTDGDGIPDSADNCIERANPGQQDSNGDGFGNACDADLNGDCLVNALDLGIFRSRFFTSDPDADFDSSGVVNPVDLGILRSLFFQPPGPSGVPNGC